MDEDDRALINISHEVGMMDFLLWLGTKYTPSVLAKRIGIESHVAPRLNDPYIVETDQRNVLI